MGYAVSVRESFLNFFFRGQAWSEAATSWYVALLTTNPSDDTGTGLVEVSTAVWTNYARVAVPRTTAGWTAPPGGTTSPQTTEAAAIVDFGTATISGTPPVLTGYVLYDAATGGTFKGWDTLASDQTVNNGDPVSIPVGNLPMEA